MIFVKVYLLRIRTNRNPKDKSRIIQYFLNDPDGYYLELCNCDVLTEFSFNKYPTIDYHEGIHNDLVNRRSIYGDIIQGFTDEDIKEALLQTNNFVRLTIKILARKRGENKYFQLASFIENGELVESEPFIVNQKNFN